MPEHTLRLAREPRHSKARQNVGHVVLRPCLPYSLRLTVLSHGWVHLPPYEWNETAATVGRIEYLPHTGASISLSITQTANQALRLNATGPVLIGDELWRELIPRVRRALAIDQDLTQVRALAMKHDHSIVALLDAGGGRLLRGTTFFEDVVKTLLTTNASWEFTTTMTRNLVALYGRAGAFPGPNDLAGVSELSFRRDAHVGYRARYLKGIVDRFLAAGLDDLPPGTRLVGLADYGATHANVLQGDYSRIPIDSEVRAYCREHHACGSDAEINETFTKWGEYAFLGYKLGRQSRKLNWIGEARKRKRGKSP